MMHSETVCDHVVAACGEAYQQKCRQMEEQTSLRETGLLDDPILNTHIYISYFFSVRPSPRFILEITGVRVTLYFFLNYSVLCSFLSTYNIMVSIVISGISYAYH